MRTAAHVFAFLTWSLFVYGAGCADELPKLNRRGFFRISIAAYLGATRPGSAVPGSATAAPPKLNRLSYFGAPRESAVIRFSRREIHYTPEEVEEYRRMIREIGNPMRAIREKQEALKDGPRQIILPRAHLSVRSMEFLAQSLESREIDWLALEAVPASLQERVDHYLTSDKTSVEFQEAKRKLEHLFSLEGEERNVAGESHPLFKTLDLARKLNVPVYAVGLPAWSRTAFHSLVPSIDRGLIATDQPHTEANPYRFLAPNSRQVVILIDEGSE